MTADLTRESLEHLGPFFDRANLLRARELTRETLASIAAVIQSGMLEEDAVEMARAQIMDAGMPRSWHDIYIRFGSNTTKMFGHPSAPGMRLKENDIFFIDIGPVWKKWEGDAGQTFVVGADPEMVKCKTDVRDIFHAVRQKWLKDRSSGRELYAHAEEEARKRGWLLNMNWSGHRLGDFPHELYYDGGLAQVEFRPSEAIWVLEIHICHPTKPYGAFFEDLLLDDEHYQVIE